MDATIQVSHLRKEYSSVVAVADLSLSVHAGCLFGFLGPNGSGKTTTLACLTGLFDPDGGEIRLFGTRFNTDAIATKRRIGVMPEGLALFDALYAHEFLAFQAGMFGLEGTTARQRVGELLDALDLAGKGRTPLADFSTGMRKRVAFAAAVIHSPDLLFLDEPFESIDPEGVALLKDWLRRFVGRGGTVFLTSHALDTVERLCDRVAIITRPGSLLWEGDITPLVAGRPLVAGGRESHTLEDLFFAVAGRRYAATLDWL